MKALNVMTIEKSLEISSLELLKSIFSNNSRARCFYLHLMNMNFCGKLIGHTDLLSRVNKICVKHNVSFFRYIFDKQYSNSVLKGMKSFPVRDGLTDCVRHLLLTRDVHNSPFS